MKHFIANVSEGETLPLLIFFSGRASIDFDELFITIKYLERSVTIRRRIKTNKHQIVAECLRYLGLRTLVYRVTEVY